ncbi:Irc19p KNAG_0E01020 [Huiozyma naganishii CBS 8797]|uniref:Uncharacterized protein n=1 Tax=Huiozyma naganishii (strain ATCC MYA-139 / BCRC 22969 / CBS 8797 / KCTC 17520 / NBRC 10181 / NCYC 3082 / Yp74L-3) TaxID=1071383 RepID=J7R689_HUIN7|nr:hypothetical protein KNAG_0E01020 [Kazachstania naganishii CBS 8797]CCK70370.1 hypothetical protein KNAG_0E01020 [Kazachstania naganishii CBS 8797]
MQLPIINTTKAVISSVQTVLKQPGRFILSCDVSEQSDAEFIRSSYRRFMRLRPLVSQRLNVKHVYTNYIAYKYRYEDYEAKRALVLTNRHLLKHDWRLVVANSLKFVIQSVDETHNNQDVAMAHRIFKSILSWQYQLRRSWKSPGEAYTAYMLSFKHLRTISSTNELTEKEVTLRLFDQCVVFLNETLKTRL